jgi:hypothetical protein
MTIEEVEALAMRLEQVRAGVVMGSAAPSIGLCRKCAYRADCRASFNDR